MNPGTVRWAMTLSRQLRKLCTDMWHDGYCACHLPSHKHPLKRTHTDALRKSAVKTLEIAPMIVSLWSRWSKGAKRNESGLLGSCGEWHGFLRLLTFLSTAVFTTFTVIILPVHQVFLIHPQWCVMDTSSGDGENSSVRCWDCEIRLLKFWKILQ